MLQIMATARHTVCLHFPDELLEGIGQMLRIVGSSHLWFQHAKQEMHPKKDCGFRPGNTSIEKLPVTNPTGS